MICNSVLRENAIQSWLKWGCSNICSLDGSSVAHALISYTFPLQTSTQTQQLPCLWGRVSVRWLVLTEHELSNEVGATERPGKCAHFSRGKFPWLFPAICIPGDKHILQRLKLYFAVSHSQGNEIAEFIKASLGNQLIWYQQALIGQWLLSVVANFPPDIYLTCPGNQTPALIAGWIKHELSVQGGRRIKTGCNPNQSDTVLTVRGLFHIIFHMKSLLVELDFVLSSSKNLKMLSQQAPTFAGSSNFLCSPPLSGNFCRSLHFGDMQAGDTCACLALREGKSPLLPPCTKRSGLFWSRISFQAVDTKESS